MSDASEDDDLTDILDQDFGEGGVHACIEDVSKTLRGSLAEHPGLLDLPELDLGPYDDPGVDIGVGRRLGTGGMGVVSLARQNALQRDVAVKEIRSKDRDAAQLLNEALMMGMVEHPNVVPVHMVGRDAETGDPVIVMKRVEGVTWDDVMEDPLNAPTDDEVIDLEYHLRVLIQLCNAVRFAHSAGVLHLDIKPDNVMLGEFGEVYLADWGIATRIGSGGTPKGSSIRGTPAYMAPEMTKPNRAAVDVRTDVFLLGATLHRLLTGRRLHEAETPLEAIKLAHRYEGPNFAEPIDPELAEITEKAVSKDPDDRYQSVEDFQQAIREYLDHRESISLVRIAERGIGRIANAIEETDGPRPEQLAETRFALHRSLEIWPENPDALELRTRLAEIVFEWALETEDLKEAARAVADLPEDQRPRLAERLESAREELAQERRELERLRSLQDQRTGKSTRLLLGVTIGLLWEAIAAYKAWKRWGVPLDDVDPNYLRSLLPTFGLPVLLLVIFHRLYLSSEFNRRFVIFFCGGMLVVAMIRIAGWAFALPAYVATSMEFISYAGLGILFGAMTDLRMSVASLILLAVAVFAMVHPGYQYAFMVVGFAIFAPIVIWIWVTAGSSYETDEA